MTADDRSGSGRLGYRPGLDGLRGLSILGVLLFHAEMPFAPGGFLGVSVFYTLSGFLITSLLLDASAREAGALLSPFWLRRVRRLLPAALLGLVLATAVGVVGAGEDQLARLRGDVLWSLGYALNWRLILEDYSYALLFSEPSPVQHFWSLAIEGQLYGVVPFFVLGARRLPGRSAAVAAGLLALASVGLCAGLTASGATTDRIYYGTDTRAAELLAGCALALWIDRQPPSGPGTGMHVLGGLALAAVVAAFVWVPLESAWLYRGGLGLFSLVSAVLVLAAMSPSGAAGRVLQLPPLVWLGRISYGVYVYHWPVFLLVTPERTGWSAALSVGVALALTFALAWLSERFVERRIRHAHSLGWPVTSLAALAGTAAVVALVLVATPRLDRDFAAASRIGAEERVDGLRVAAFGDSTMLTLRTGIGPWLRERGATMRPGVTSKGCGLLPAGRVRIDSEAFPERPACATRGREWRAAIAKDPIDLAIVMVGPWDVLPRRLPGDDRYRGPGDPAFDARLERAVAEAVDLLAAGGARVVWLTTPHFAPSTTRPRKFHLYNREVDRFNEIVRDVSTRRPETMRVVELGGWVAADAKRAVDPELRADGVHWTVRGARALSESWLGPQLLAALRDLDTAARERAKRTSRAPAFR